MKQILKDFKLGIAFITTSSKHIPLENKPERSCVEFCKGDFMSMISKIIDDAGRIARL